MPVYLTNLKGDVLETTVAELLPGAFSKEDLKYAANKLTHSNRDSFQLLVVQTLGNRHF